MGGSLLEKGTVRLRKHTKDSSGWGCFQMLFLELQLPHWESEMTNIRSKDQLPKITEESRKGLALEDIAEWQLQNLSSYHQPSCSSMAYSGLASVTELMLLCLFVFVLF